MVEKLCENYGTPVGQMDEKMYFTFPTVSALAGDNVEHTLRQLGFGYRAKYISETAKYIVKNHDSNWLHSLREKPHDEAKKSLMKLHGVGAKVGRVNQIRVILPFGLCIRSANQQRPNIIVMLTSCLHSSPFYLFGFGTAAACFQSYHSLAKTG